MKMSNPYIDVFECSNKHIIFTGRNALLQAVVYDKVGRIATPDELYRLRRARIDFEECTSWGIGDMKTENNVLGTYVKGDGVHAKMYTLQSGSVIMSSQNNCSSVLFEFAILYKGENSSLRNFIKKSIERAASFSEWFKRNSKW